MNLSPSQWLLAVLAALCLGMSKSGLGGLGIPAILLMAAVFPARASTGIILPMLVMADFLASRALRAHAQWSHVVRLLPPACAGVVAGFFLMRWIPAEHYRAAIGWIVLVMSVLQAVKMGVSLNTPLFRAWPFAATMGGLAGVTTMMANAAGPVMSLYLAVVELPKMAFVATGALFFLVINLFKIPFSAAQGLITWQTLGFNLLLLPIIAAGVWTGRWIIGRISQRTFEILVLAGSFLASLRLILS